jgi:hypothetical protein
MSAPAPPEYALLQLSEERRAVGRVVLLRLTRFIVNQLLVNAAYLSAIFRLGEFPYATLLIAFCRATGPWFIQFRA